MFEQNGSKIGFKKNDTKTNKNCKSLKEIDYDIFFKTSRYNPSKFHKNAVDFKEFLDFMSNNSKGYGQIEFHSFKGFDIDIFDQNDMTFDVYFFLLNFPFSMFYTINDVNNYMGSLKGEFGAYFQLVYSVIFLL